MARVELLWWEGCPSTARAREQLKAAMAEAGLDPGALVETEVTSEREAGERAFVGSPTIRIDGRDVAPPPEGEPAGLTCRVYRRRDGRFSPLPDAADVRDAIEEALR
jgi:hypothetical protein